jgi:hypothetical protein
MASNIDITKPSTTEAYTQDVRDNFATAAAEIGALQDAAMGPATTGQIVLGTPPASAVISVGSGAPGGATPGFDQNGSLYIDSAGQPGTVIYVSAGDSTWTPLG